ncbi:hypothetical protein [Persephonella sp.]
MRNIFISLCLIFVFAGSSLAQNEIFSEMENTVGYIEDEKGNKYLVIETPEGAKLIKTEKDPEKIIRDSLGISKDDLNIRGE